MVRVRGYVRRTKSGRTRVKEHRRSLDMRMKQLRARRGLKYSKSELQNFAVNVFQKPGMTLRQEKAYYRVSGDIERGKIKTLEQIRKRVRLAK